MIGINFIAEGSNLSELDDTAPESEIILMNIIEEINKQEIEKEETDTKKVELQKRLNCNELSLLKKHENYFAVSPESGSDAVVMTSKYVVLL